MPVSTMVLASTFPSLITANTGAYLAVEMDLTTHGNVKIVPTTPDNSFVGFLDQNGAVNDSMCNVQMLGIIPCQSDGAAVINPGNPVIASGATAGQVKALTLSSGSTLRQIYGICVNKAQVPATASATVLVSMAPQFIYCT